MTTITGPCAEDPEAFFPASTDHAAIQHAKALCHTCPAQAACLELAMSNEHGNAKGRDGIYGGTTPAERARMDRGKPRPVSHGTEGGYRTHKRRGEPACQRCTEASALAKAISRERAS
jgi:WhiB family transcriptional regulator, redox-sensing transcriptional regulator